MPFDDDHASFEEKPAEDYPVWRYMDLARFVSMLEQDSLTFARADIMDDKWEGAYGALTIQAMKAQEALMRATTGDYPGDITQLTGQLAQMMYMSCWHASRYESAAMWSIYQREGRGVAIKSTWRQLKASIGPTVTVSGGLVEYVDYNRTFINPSNGFNPFMRKRLSFAHEKEVRLLTLYAPRDDETAAAPPSDNPTDTTTETQSPISGQPPVIHVPVNLDTLINSVYVAPEADDWFVELIRQIVKRYGHQFVVQQSELGMGPST